MRFLPVLFAVASAATFGSYYDANCSLPITNTIIFTDVCTWTSDQYTGALSLYLKDCSNKQMNAVVFNASDAPTCIGTPVSEVTITDKCTKLGNGGYVQGLDFTCESQNTTYNILAHFQTDCKDGGLPFSVRLGEGTCQTGSFAPGFFNWDTEGAYSAPYYEMELYNTTNGTCQDERAVFQTENFPAECVKSNTGFQGISVDIYQAFPV